MGTEKTQLAFDKMECIWKYFYWNRELFSELCHIFRCIDEDIIMWTRSHEEFFLVECTSTTLDKSIHSIDLIRSVEVPVWLLREEGSRRDTESSTCESDLSRGWYYPDREMRLLYLLGDSDQCEVCGRSRSRSDNITICDSFCDEASDLFFRHTIRDLTRPTEG